MQVAHFRIKPAAGAVEQAGGVQGLGVQGHALRLQSRQCGQSLKTRPRRQEWTLGALAMILGPFSLMLHLQKR